MGVWAEPNENGEAGLKRCAEVWPEKEGAPECNQSLRGTGSYPPKQRDEVNSTRTVAQSGLVRFLS
jgi:hypothetical protein